MPSYLLAYHGGGVPATEAARAKTMAAWESWFKTLGPAIADAGNPVGRAKTVSLKGASDGGGANPVTGYSLITASDLNAAVELAKGCPIVADGGTIEVCETFQAM